MKAIVAVDQNWAIGKDGQLLGHLSPDMKRFRELTKGKIVIYGRKTLETFPGAKPLPYRQNIILSRNPDYQVEGAVTVHSVKELEETLKGLSGEYDKDDRIVIGGDSIYRQLLPLCDTVLVTRVERTYDADAWFPNLDEDPEWECRITGELQEYEGIPYHFDDYYRI